MTRLRAVLRRDEGASMILALALVIGVGLIVGALVTYAGTSLTASARSTEVVQRSYDVDGALQTAVNAVRTSTFNQDVGETCLDDGLLELPAAGAERVVVRCSPRPGTGADSGIVQIDDGNRLASAIHVGTGSMSQRATAATEVRGAVISNGGIGVSGVDCAPDATYPGNDGSCAGLWSPWGQITAKDACIGTVVSQPAANCGSGSTTALPTYPQPVAPLTYRAVGTCSSYGVTAEFDPGYYDDAAALSALMNGSCDKTFRFNPGVYYFDFHNDYTGGDAWPVAKTGSNEWLISGSDVHVVGGEAEGSWLGTSNPPPFPGACTSPVEDEAADGVTFVFGGTSRMRVTAGTVELCGTYYTDAPPITLFGASTDLNVVLESNPLEATALPSGGTPGPFTPSDPALFAEYAEVGEDDGVRFVSATLTRSPTSTRSVTATFNGYAPSATIPAGSIVTGATLFLRHREVGFRGDESVIVSFDPNGSGGTDLYPAAQPKLRAGFGTDSIDMATQAFIDHVHANGFTGGAVSYRVEAPNGTGDIGTAVDRATWEIEYIPPGVRQQSSNTAMITTTGSSTRFRVDGAVYGPRAHVDVSLPGVDYLVVSGGVVADRFAMGIAPVSSFLKPVIQTPVKSTGKKPVEVYFSAYTCAESCGADPPSTGWSLAGEASASFVDAGTVPVAHSRRVVVNSWHLDE